jgi:signal transduction histidine kinase
MSSSSNSFEKNFLLKKNFEIVSVFLDYSDWTTALKQVFAMVGEHVKVDRIYFFEFHKDSTTQEELTSQRFEWVKNGIEPMIDNPDLQNLPVEIAADFMRPLKDNKPFEAIVRLMPEGNTKEILSSQDILSILVLPIWIEGMMYGFIGFDDCTNERGWNEEELHFLQSITSNLSSAISRRNAMLEVERKAKELERINHELEQFAYVASHDLQEPLRMISEFLKLFEKKYAAAVDEKGRTYIHYAVEGSLRMKKIILDLLEFSRVGKTKSAMEEVDVEELFNSLKLLYVSKIETLKADVQLVNPIKVLTWKSPLEQVLMNLLDNALKYAKSDVSPKIELRMEEQEHQWLFHFTDNGIGIPPKYFDRIFIIFQRLHTKEEYEGSGMGLAITKKIIENIGGRIWVESEPEVGTSFHFSLPKSINR